MEFFGKTEEVEFVPGGKEIDVTDENKYEYVQKKAYYKLYLSVKKQIDSFL
jgi:E3 ubiquitin-protein ligase HUWE1